MQESDKKDLPKGPIKYPTLFGMAYRYKRADTGAWSFGINYIRALIVLVVFFLVMWSTMAIFLFAFMKHYKGYDNMTFRDAFVMPFDRKNITIKHGNYNIEKAEALLKEGDYMGARINLIAGTGRSPKNLKGRKMLAEFQLRLMRRSDHALNTLEVALPYAMGDLQYIRFYFSILLEDAEDAKIIAVGKKILDSPQASQNVKIYTAMTMATVYALHGNYSKSDSFIYDYKLESVLPGLMRLSKNQWEQGHRDEAIRLIADTMPKIQDVEPLYAMLMSYYLNMGNYEKARQYAIMRSVEKPFSITQRIDYLKVLNKTGETDKVKKELDILFSQNKGSEKALMYLANFAADQGDIDLMNKIYNTSIENNYSQAPFTLLMVETLLMNNKSSQAVGIFEEILKKKPSWMKRSGDVFNCLRAASYYGIGNVEMATILVDEILKAGTVPPRTLIATARRFDKMGAKNIAHKILVDAVEKNPRHQLALTRLVQMEIEMGNSTNLDRHIFRLLQMRRPPRSLVLESKRSLDSDSFIFTTDREKVMNEIDILLQKENTSDIKLMSDFGDVENDRIVE